MDLFKSQLVPEDLKAKYEGEAGRYWDLFYRRNGTRFFKDRHYFEREFPQLLGARAVLEVGCGVGNTAFPLLELNPTVQVYACDFAASAIKLLRQHPEYAASGRCAAFVADITADDLTAHVPAGSVDVATMIFVLSAVAPEAMPRALRRVAATLRPGAQLLFRDYAAGDLAQGRLSGGGRQQQLSDNFYVRWDGTCAFYFTEDALRRLFEAEGFRCEYVRAADKEFENRKRGLHMDRRFLQALFTFAGVDSSGGGGGSACGSSTGDEGGAHGLTRQHDPLLQQLAGAGHTQRPGAEEQLEELRLSLGGTELQLAVRPPPQGPGGAGRTAAEALAALVLACPAYFCNSHILELCSWDAPLASLAALRWCRRAVAAGSSEAAVGLLRRNARRNGHLFIIERLRLLQLPWASSQACGRERRLQQQLEQLHLAFPAGFHVVLAALPEVPRSTATSSNGGGGWQEDVQQLLRSAAALLSRQPGSLVLLCATQPEAVQAAAAGVADVGLAVAAAIPDELAAATTAAASNGVSCLALQHSEALWLHLPPPLFLFL